MHGASQRSDLCLAGTLARSLSLNKKDKSILHPSEKVAPTPRSPHNLERGGAWGTRIDITGFAAQLLGMEEDKSIEELSRSPDAHEASALANDEMFAKIKEYDVNEEQHVDTHVSLLNADL